MIVQDVQNGFVLHVIGTFFRTNFLTRHRQIPFLCQNYQNVTIEKHLVTPVIPFMKIIPLPKGQQKGLHGPVVCVPSDISSLTHTLPRELSDDTLIKVKLKRKLQYKGHHLFQQVSMQKLRIAMEHLKAVNPYYTGKAKLNNE